MAELSKAETNDATHVRHMSRLITSAERGGFEPPNEVNPRYAISSRARSTTPAPLREGPG